MYNSLYMCVLGEWTCHSITECLGPVFENTYFTFFSDLKKHDFLRFFEMTFQKVVERR